MGSDVVPDRTLLESKCKLPHMELLVNPVDIYSPAAQMHRQELSPCSS